MTNQSHPAQSPYDENGAPRPGHEAPPRDHGAQDGYGAYRGYDGYGGDSAANPNGVDSDERGLAVVAHIATLVALYVSAGWLGFVVPLVLWFIAKDSKPFVRQAAAGAFNFNIMLLIVNVVATLIAVFTLGVGLIVSVPLWIAAGIAALVCHILGTIRATKGEAYRYPLQIPILS